MAQPLRRSPSPEAHLSPDPAPNAAAAGLIDQERRGKKHRDHAYSRPTLCHGVPRIFLTVPLSYESCCPTRGPMREASALRKTRNQFYRTAQRHRPTVLLSPSLLVELLATASTRGQAPRNPAVFAPGVHPARLVGSRRMCLPRRSVAVCTRQRHPGRGRKTSCNFRDSLVSIEYY
jgi:hypothetical protein